MFDNIYRNKKVLITGHTGFKGSWLSVWLLSLGAKVVGISNDIPTSPSLFKKLSLESKITHYKEDIRKIDAITEIIDNEKPDFLFHLAAQAIVSVSYSNPMETITSNVIGTSNILEALRILNKKITAVFITSDKAYDNVEQIWGYKETDQMGGKDVYSGSKGAAELIIKSYYHSFFKSEESNVKLSIARAGNVIGGGDWAKDRIVVDCMQSWSENKVVEIRSPKATRPWQHVLEPLSGYLNLGQVLYNDDFHHGEGYNFGPRAEQNRTVEDLLIDLSKYWNYNDTSDAYIITGNIPFHEAGLLKLNCDKALAYLNWQATLEYKDTIRFTSEWYYDFYKTDLDMYDKTLEQISEFEDLAQERELLWAN